MLANSATAGEWEKSRMSADYDYSYDTSLPAFTYQSDKWLPHEFAKISVLVPRDMPDWTRANRPRNSADHARFYAGIVPEIRRGAFPSGNMKKILEYCYKKVGENDVKMGECLYLTAQANMTIVLNFALDASTNGKYGYAEPVFQQIQSQRYMTLRVAKERDKNPWQQHFYNRRDAGQKEAFYADIKCNFDLDDPDNQRWKFSTRSCDNTKSESGASAAFGRLYFTVASLKEYRKKYDSIGIRFTGANVDPYIIYIPLKSVTDRLAPWMN